MCIILIMAPVFVSLRIILSLPHENPQSELTSVNTSTYCPVCCIHLKMFAFSLWLKINTYRNARMKIGVGTRKVTWIVFTDFFSGYHMCIATLYLTTFPSTGDRLLVWRLFWLAPIPFSSHLLLELKSMFQPFHPLCRLPQPGQSLSGSTRLTFPSRCSTYGGLHNWLGPPSDG